MEKDKLPKSWEEFCELYIAQRKDMEAYHTLMQLHQLRDCYRQGWTPNMAKNERVYCILPYRLHRALYVDSYYAYYRFLTFQTKELAEEFIKNFSDMILSVIDLLL